MHRAWRDGTSAGGVHPLLSRQVPRGTPRTPPACIRAGRSAVCPERNQEGEVAPRAAPMNAPTEGRQPVSDLVQIVYVSRSTFTAMPAELGIEPSVARILAQSRINNARRGLVGAHQGNAFF